ncbi:MAG: DUF4410 domain-containing protein [Holophagales bacterium]|nr:DUF4410 domain-containing protein [Holophagales bacterium]
MLGDLCQVASRVRIARATATTLAVLVLAGTLAGPAEARKKNKNPPGTLDDGKLVFSWFGDENLRFVKDGEIDYLWVKEGFSLADAAVHFQEWADPEFLGEGAEDRDAEDRRLARQMNSEMPRLFQEEWARVLGAPFSLEKGDVVAAGRIVDCSTGSTAAKVLVGFGAGAGYTTIDLKLTDKSSGELLMAIHHRVVSGTSWSTTDSKFAKWVGEFAEEMRDAGGAYALYSKGKAVKK